MKKTFAVLLVVLAIAGLSSSASAYVVNWYDGFEGYANGPLDGQGPWHATVPATSPIVAGYSGSKVAEQVSGVSGASADLRPSGSLPGYYKGFAKFWVFDPGDINGLVTDGKAGVFSSAGADSASKMSTAGVQSSRSHSFWTIGWSYSSVVADGISASAGTGYSFTPGPAAPRTYNAWSSVLIDWTFRYTSGDRSQGSATIKWYINRQAVPNMVLDFDSTSSRWANSHDVVGVFIGSLSSQTHPTSYDNLEFHVVPEPSGLLALGGGALGLLGMIRRRR